MSLEKLLSLVRRCDATNSTVLSEQPAGDGRGHDRDIRQGLGCFDKCRHESQAVVFGPVPTVHAIAFLKLHVSPLGTTALGPVIKVMKRMLEVKPCPHFIGCATSPFNPIYEGHVRRVVNALCLLQRCSDNAASAAGNSGRSATRISLFQYDGLASGPGNFDGSGNPRAAAADD